MSDTQTDETTPDQLMEAFRGRSLKSILLFTVVVHVVLLLGTSASFLVKEMTGGDSAKLTEEKRMENAVRAATESLREIAEEHGLNAQDLSSQFANGKPKASKEPATPTKAPGDVPEGDVEEPKSAIEKEIEKVETGPGLPGVEDEEEDLFK